MKTRTMISSVVGIVFSLIIVAALLPQGLAAILDIANVNVTTSAGEVPFSTIATGAVLSLFGVLALIVVIGIIMKFVKGTSD